MNVHERLAIILLNAVKVTLHHHSVSMVNKPHVCLLLLTTIVKPDVPLGESKKIQYLCRSNASCHLHLSTVPLTGLLVFLLVQKVCCERLVSIPVANPRNYFLTSSAILITDIVKVIFTCHSNFIINIYVIIICVLQENVVTDNYLFQKGKIYYLRNMRAAVLSQNQLRVARRYD